MGSGRLSALAVLATLAGFWMTGPARADGAGSGQPAADQAPPDLPDDGSGELPHFPKAKPPQPLPEPVCDATRADAGDWLLGHWTGTGVRLEVRRQGAGVVWHLSGDNVASKFNVSAVNGLSGTATALSPCTVSLSAGAPSAFVFEAVLTEDGQLFGYATDPDGDDIRFSLRHGS